MQSGEAYDGGTVAGPVTIATILAFGVLCLVAFVWRQHRNTREPLVPLRLFHHRDFSAAATAGGAMGAAMGGLFLPLMIYLQSDLGYSPLAAGAATVPLFVGPSRRWASRCWPGSPPVRRNPPWSAPPPGCSTRRGSSAGRSAAPRPESSSRPTSATPPPPPPGRLWPSPW
ncbi:hypothetical protein ACIGD1_35800 [Streptomyces sp. NPDC085612]|uniref:hypothetical protein n=1 Tax=Streptomyces sp. NPDC085612 TaxID=3365732 RepID=UPI0037D8F197